MTRLNCLVIVACFWQTSWSMELAAEPRPNILLLITDDQCFDTIAALGHREVKTPNLDRLARRGVSFSNAYNMGGWNGAICVASRTMMNTGRFIWRAHAVDDRLNQEATAGRMVPQMFKRAGYETFFSGKWHVKIKAESIFEHTQHIRPGMPTTLPSSYGRPNDKGDWEPWDEQLGGFWEGGKHWSEVLADDAESFLEIATKNDSPFYLQLAFNAPHDPRQSPREFVELYDREQIEIPSNFMPENPFMNEMGAGKSLRDERLAPWPRTYAAVQLHRQEYYALITHLDAQVGRILDALERTGQADRTYIVMTADHGLACGQHGLLGKQSMYEHSMKAPLILVGPNVPEDKRIDTPVYIQDFVATALEWADIEQPEHVEFKSLMPLVRGERESQYEAMYGAYEMDKQRMIRKGDYKLIYYPDGDHYLLFNVVQDPQEQIELSDHPERSDILKSLQGDLRELMKSMGDPLVKL